MSQGLEKVVKVEVGKFHLYCVGRQCGSVPVHFHELVSVGDKDVVHGDFLVMIAYRGFSYMPCRSGHIDVGWVDFHVYSGEHRAFYCGLQGGGKGYLAVVYAFAVDFPADVGKQVVAVAEQVEVQPYVAFLARHCGGEVEP